MSQSNDEKVQNYLTQTVFAGTASPDLTTNIIRRLLATTGDMAARFIAIILAAGGKN